MLLELSDSVVSHVPIGLGKVLSRMAALNIVPECDQETFKHTSINIERFSPTSQNLSKRENPISISKSFFKVSLILALERDYIYTKVLHRDNV